MVNKHPIKLNTSNTTRLHAKVIRINGFFVFTANRRPAVIDHDFFISTLNATLYFQIFRTNPVDTLIYFSNLYTEQVDFGRTEMFCKCLTTTITTTYTRCIYAFVLLPLITFSYYTSRLSDTLILKV